MLKQGILIRDCSSFVGLNEFYIRVAVKTHEENVRLIDAFKKALKTGLSELCLRLTCLG